MKKRSGNLYMKIGFLGYLIFQALRYTIEINDVIAFAIFIPSSIFIIAGIIKNKKASLADKNTN